jgi:hypothetical protein
MVNRLRLSIFSRRGDRERRLDVSAHGRELVVIVVVAAIGVIALAALWTVRAWCC